VFYQSKTEGKEHLLLSAGNTPPNTAEEAFGLPFCKGTEDDASAKISFTSSWSACHPPTPLGLSF